MPGLVTPTRAGPKRREIWTSVPSTRWRGQRRRARATTISRAASAVRVAADPAAHATLAVLVVSRLVGRGSFGTMVQPGFGTGAVISGTSPAVTTSGAFGPRTPPVSGIRTARVSAASQAMRRGRPAAAASRSRASAAAATMPPVRAA